MRKNDPDWEDDETAPVCLAQDLSAWTLAQLRECGVDEAFLATARKHYEEETIYGKDGNPTEDFSAYILRRDWASRARNICGYTSVEIDLQLGRKVDTPRYKRPNLKLAAEQEKLAAKAERYVYSLVGTQNPEYTPILLQAGDRKEIPTFKTVKYCNGSDKPVLVAITFDAMENADAVQLTAPCGAMRKTAFTSRPDDPNQRRNRPIIGRQKEEK